MGRGLGWFVLLCGTVAGILSAFPQALPDAHTRRLIAGIALGLGTMMLIYLLGSSLRHVTYGALLVVASYFCIGVSLFGQRQLLPAISPSPSH